MLIYRRKWLIPCDFIVMCYCKASVPWCIVVMHHHRDTLWCVIIVMHRRYDVSTWCIKSVIRDWLYVTFYWYDACMMCWDTVWWMLMHGCWWMNDECWCMNVDERMMDVDAWMFMNELWVLMNVDGWMMNKWCRLMNVRCMLNDVWCIDAFVVCDAVMYAE